MPTTTARELIRRSLLLIGVIANRTAMPADMASDGLHTLNDLLASWSLERFMAYHIPRVDVPLVPGKGVYTWGLPGGDISSPRPLRLDGALLNIGDVGASGAYEWPIAVWSQSEYESGIALKQQQSPYPVGAYLETTFPLARLHVYLVPTAPWTLGILAWQPLTEFASLDTQVTLPPGYERALRCGLAVDLAPEFGRVPDPTIIAMLEQARRNVRMLNVRVPTLDLGLGCGGSGQDDWTAVYRG